MSKKRTKEFEKKAHLVLSHRDSHDSANLKVKDFLSKDIKHKFIEFQNKQNILLTERNRKQLEDRKTRESMSLSKSDMRCSISQSNTRKSLTRESKNYQ